MRRPRTPWLIWAALVVLLFGMVALTGGVYFNQENNTKNTDFLAIGSDALGQLQQTSELFGVGISFTSFTAGDALKVQLDFQALNNLAGDGDGSAPTQQVCFQSNSLSLNFTANVDMSPSSASIPLPGDINWYPFDVYTGEFDFIATTGDDCSTPLPIVPEVAGSLQGFSVTTGATPVPINGTNFAGYSFTFTSKRTPAIRAFAVLGFLIMWILTMSVFTLTTWIWLTGRRTELAIISICTALLFALPNVRNAQPGIPKDVGVIADLVGYIWCILLVSLCVVGHIVNWIYRKDGKKKKPAVVNPPPKV